MANNMPQWATWYKSTLFYRYKKLSGGHKKKATNTSITFFFYCSTSGYYAHRGINPQAATTF